MVGWHHQLDGHKFQQALGVDDGQRSLACCSSWGYKELDQAWKPGSQHAGEKRGVAGLQLLSRV